MPELRLALMILGIILLLMLLFWQKRKAIFNAFSLESKFKSSSGDSDEYIDEELAEKFESDFEDVTYPKEPIILNNLENFIENDNDKFSIDTEVESFDDRDNNISIKDPAEKLIDQAATNNKVEREIASNTKQASTQNANIKETNTVDTSIGKEHSSEETPASNKNKPVENPFQKYLDEDKSKEKSYREKAAESQASSKSQNTSNSGINAKNVGTIEDNAASQAYDSKKQKSKRKILSLVIKAKSDSRFNGKDIDSVATSAGLIFGNMNIYHKDFEMAKPGQYLFSLANLIEPGFFDPNNMGGIATPGLVLFAQLPSPYPANKVFDDMLITADTIAKELGGVVMTDKREPISAEWIEKVKYDIADFEIAAV